MIRDYTAAYNASIATLAAARGIPVVDFNAQLTEIRTHGLPIAGIEITADFISGGFFSFDGVHPNAFGNAYGANLFIEAVNANYGAKIPSVGLYPFLTGAPAGATSFGSGDKPQDLVLQGWSNWMKLFSPEHCLMGAKNLR